VQIDLDPRRRADFPRGFHAARHSCTERLANTRTSSSVVLAKSSYHFPRLQKSAGVISAVEPGVAFSPAEQSLARVIGQPALDTALNASLKHRCEDRFFANSSYRPLLPPVHFLSFSWFKVPYRDDYSLLANWQLLGISCALRVPPAPPRLIAPRNAPQSILVSAPIRGLAIFAPRPLPRVVNRIAILIEPALNPHRCVLVAQNRRSEKVVSLRHNLMLIRCYICAIKDCAFTFRVQS